MRPELRPYEREPLGRLGGLRAGDLPGARLACRVEQALALGPARVQQDEGDLLDRRAEVRLDVLDGVGREVLRVAHDHDLALGEERGAGQLGERAGLQLVGRQIAYVRVGVGSARGRHHLLHRTVQEEVLLAHGEGEGGERIVGGILPGGHRRPGSHAPLTAPTARTAAARVRGGSAGPGPSRVRGGSGSPGPLRVGGRLGSKAPGCDAAAGLRPPRARDRGDGPALPYRRMSG